MRLSASLRAAHADSFTHHPFVLPLRPNGVKTCLMWPPGRSSRSRCPSWTLSSLAGTIGTLSQLLDLQLRIDDVERAAAQADHCLRTYTTRSRLLLRGSRPRLIGASL